jgi:basic amino acid/polyamine antiporter, APA family
MSQLFRRKPISEIRHDPADVHAIVEPTLRRSLGVWQLTALGIGAIIGAGIFSGAGTAISGGPNHLGAGPGLVLS